MIANIFALLLGASAVLSNEPSCSHVRTMLLKAGKFKSGEWDRTLQTANFENSVEIVRKSDVRPTTLNHVFSVQSNGGLPEVTFDGTSYKLYRLEIAILNVSDGTAILAVTYTDGSNEARKDVNFIVPLLSAAENDSKLNEDLNRMLRSLGATPKKGIHKSSFAWLQQLLPNVSFIEPTPANVKAFMTACQKVVVDDYLMPGF